MVIVVHHGLFIYIDTSYPESFYDVNFLRQSKLYKQWRDHFVDTNEYFEYLLGDLAYLGEDKFIKRWIEVRELPPDANLPTVEAYNKKHAGERVKVQWKIEGLKRK